jgi:hypothetical protein
MMAEIVDTVGEEVGMTIDEVTKWVDDEARRELRNRFVVAIVTGALGVRINPSLPPEEVAKAAFNFADALVAEAERRDNPDGL